MSIIYHSVNENVVADTLSQLSMDSVAHVNDGKKELIYTVQI